MADYVNNYPASSLDSNHWTGSTKIGASSSYSVVDTNTKVWNTNNLVSRYVLSSEWNT